MQPNDSIRIKHMLEAAREAVVFSEGRERKDLENNRMLVLAIVKSLEIIGEAASKVSESCQANFNHIPWPEIINMRHRMIHAYYDVNLDIVWATVTQDLPGLIKELESLLSNGTDLQ
jgi:uncharacterized protein with HEPN domain